MVTLYDRINMLCESRGIKGGKMCVDTGISKGLLTDLKMGRRTGVSAVTALKIAEYFGITVDELYGREPLRNEENPTAQEGSEVDALSESQRKLMEFAKTVPEDKADMILRVMKSIVEGD